MSAKTAELVASFSSYMFSMIRPANARHAGLQSTIAPAKIQFQKEEFRNSNTPAATKDGYEFWAEDQQVAKDKYVSLLERSIADVDLLRAAEILSV